MRSFRLWNRCLLPGDAEKFRASCSSSANSLLRESYRHFFRTCSVRCIFNTAPSVCTKSARRVSFWNLPSTRIQWSGKANRKCRLLLGSARIDAPAADLDFLGDRWSVKQVSYLLVRLCTPCSSYFGCFFLPPNLIIGDCFVRFCTLFWVRLGFVNNGLIGDLKAWICMKRVISDSLFVYEVLRARKLRSSSSVNKYC